MVEGVTVAVHFDMLIRGWPRDALVVGRSPDEIGDSDSDLAIDANTPFNAAWSKSEWVNHLLEIASEKESEWLAVIDADVIVPDYERILACLSRLPAGKLIVGSAGRRIVQSDRAIPTSPPRIRLQRFKSVVGFFQVFGKGYRYPESEAIWGNLHDDWRFYDQFGPEHAVSLPFAVYHIGDTHRHWGGCAGASATRQQPISRNAPLEPRVALDLRMLSGRKTSCSSEFTDPGMSLA